MYSEHKKTAHACDADISCCHALMAGLSLIRGSRSCAGHFLALRCQELLDAFPTSLAEDVELRNGGNLGPDMLMSLQYRLRKKATLMAAIDVNEMHG